LDGGVAPIITFRAENNVKVDASLTDGFFQIANPTTPLTTIGVPPGSDYSTVDAEFNAAIPESYYQLPLTQYFYNYPQVTAPHKFDASADPGEVAQYEGQYNAYLQFLSQQSSGGDAFGHTMSAVFWAALFTENAPVAGQPVLTVSAPTAAEEAANPASYLIYLKAYETAFNVLVAERQNNEVAGFLAFPLPPPAALGPVIGSPTISVGNPRRTTPRRPSQLPATRCRC